MLLRQFHNLQRHQLLLPQHFNIISIIKTICTRFFSKFCFCFSTTNGPTTKWMECPIQPKWRIPKSLHAFTPLDALSRIIIDNFLVLRPNFSNEFFQYLLDLIVCLDCLIPLDSLRYILHNPSSDYMPVENLHANVLIRKWCIFLSTVDNKISVPEKTAKGHVPWSGKRSLILFPAKLAWIVLCRLN